MKMKRLMLAGLLAPAIAFAQGGQQQGQGTLQPGGQQNQQQIGSQKIGQEAAQRGLIQGVVKKIDFTKGTLSLSAGAKGGKAMELKGTPGQLQMFKQGEFASVNYVTYAGNNWLAVMEGPMNAQSFTRAATVVGAVQDVNKAQGTLTISQAGKSLQLKAHPITIEPLVPGQFVSVTYQQVGQQPWLQSVQVSQGGQGGGGQQQGGQQQQQQGGEQQ